MMDRKAAGVLLLGILHNTLRSKGVIPRDPPCRVLPQTLIRNSCRTHVQDLVMLRPAMTSSPAAFPKITKFSEEVQM